MTITFTRQGRAGGDLTFLIREPAEVYHAKAKDFLSSHQLATFRDSPLLFRRKQLGLVPEAEWAELVIGRAAHTLILEGRDEYDRRYAVGGPVNERTGNVYGARTKAYARWAQQQGKAVLTDAWAATVEAVFASAQSHPLVQKLLGAGQAEGVVRVRYRGLPCQARLDWLNSTLGLVDLKTCDHIGRFARDVKYLGYFHQLAFYRSLLTEATGQVVPARLVAVEKSEPFRCGVWLVASDVLAAAQRENEEAMDRLARCRELDHWPTGYEELRVFDQF
jgi:hypothetical protein